MLCKSTVVALAALSHHVLAGAPSAPVADDPMGSSCYDVKKAYQDSKCCSANLAVKTEYTIAKAPPKIVSGDNPCDGMKLDAAIYPLKDNIDCIVSGATYAAEQSGTNVTKGYVGNLSTDVSPISTTLFEHGLCPVNVHWHLGAEHLSAGEFDENGKGPSVPGTTAAYSPGRRQLHEARRLPAHRRLGADRGGFQCHHYQETDSRFTTPYDWKHCVDMEVGETYEVHWPHSRGGACHTPNQYQTPFYDGVFCNIAKATEGGTHNSIGVHGQVFTIINDEGYYWPDMIRGMIVDGDMGKDVTYYTGSTTGTSRDNTICSQYAPITWQVDRKCHLVSASSFDKMCADMKAQRDDMSKDLYPHGARELVADIFAANNHIFD